LTGFLNPLHPRALVRAFLYLSFSPFSSFTIFSTLFFFFSFPYDFALMASFGLVVEDSSPLVSYAPDGAWVDTIDDPMVTSYSGGSFHKTTAQGATATIAFNGTSVKFFGGRRPDYGNYTITVDNQVVQTGTARNQNPSMRNLMGSATNLPDGPHTAVLTSNGGGGIDFDWLEVAPHIGTPGSKISAAVIGDADSRITYLPSDDAWTVNNDPQFTEQTAHSSTNADASATVKFTGEAIGVYGTVSADHSALRVNVDGQDRKTDGRNNAAKGSHPQTLLYFEDSLGPGEHTMVVSANPRADGGPPLIDIDSMSVFASAENAAISSGPASGPSGPSKAMIGGIVGGVVGLLLILALILLLVLRRRRPRWSVLSRTKDDSNVSPLSPELPIQTPGMLNTPSMMEAGVLTPKPAMSFAEFSGSRQGSIRQSLSPSFFTDVYLSPTPMARAPSPASSNGSTAFLIGDGGGDDTTLTPPPPAKIPGGPSRPKQRPPTLDFGLFRSK
jgi:hypothetical protein